MMEFPQPTIVAVADMEASTSRTDMAKRRARKAMYSWLERGLGSVWTACSQEDRGDGVLMLWRQAVPEAVPIKIIVSALLGLPDTAPPPPDGPRLRIAIGTGQVFRDERGYVGAAVDLTFRLNEADLLKAALAAARGPVAYLLADAVHESVIGYGYDEFDPSAFHSAVVTVKESTLHAWLHVPREDDLAARLAARTKARPQGGNRQPDTPRQTSEVNLNIGRDAHISGPIAGRDLHGWR